MILQQHFSKWCVWRLGPTRKDGKPGKIPINPNTGGGAKVNDPDTFGTFEEARSKHSEGGYAGVGALMESGPGMVCVDIDDCLSSEGKPNEIATWTLQNFKGYCEISQSGWGLHFFMRASKPPGCGTKVKRGGCSLEIYGADDKNDKGEKSERYICVTGRAYRDVCGDVVAEQAALDRFITRYGFLKAAAVDCKNLDTKQHADAAEEEHGDEEIIKLLKRNNKRGKITRLMAGELVDYDGDHSAADLALASEIAYYTGDAAQVERIFGTSGLAKRDKWRERTDYREETIRKAISSAKGYYWDGPARKKERTKAVMVEVYADKLIDNGKGLVLSKSGKPLSTVSNALHILLNDHRVCGALGFNLFSGSPEALRPLRDIFGSAATNTGGEFYEHDVTAIRVWFNREWGVGLSKADTWDVVLLWARHGEFNPVKARLDTCAKGWDGVPRLNTWLQDYLGADTPGSLEYVQSIGRKWLIGAVARAEQPGCKMDTMLILEGAQGAGKSRAVRVLAEAVYGAGFVENIPVIGDKKETALTLRGALIVELAELASMQGRAAEHVKAFLSTQEDTVREPYERRHVKWKRTVSFVGTTNETEYLQDTTGGRRFWCVRVGKIDLDKLRLDAAQLWGEAVHAYRNGEAWHLQDVQALKQAGEQQHARLFSESWDDAVSECAQSLASKGDESGGRWELRELFSLTFPTQEGLDTRPPSEQKRFASALRRCGFDNKKMHGCMRWHLTNEKIREVRGAC